jgi:hypothetical protein
MAEKACITCEEVKPLDQFWKDKRRKDGCKARCAPCAIRSNRESYNRNPAARVAAAMRWRQKNSERHYAYTRDHRQVVKARLIAGYGGECTCCGETEIAFLTLEHINGGGRAHRAIKDSLGIYREVIKAGFPPEYTVLCMNCNFARRYGKECPHQTAEKLLDSLE